MSEFGDLKITENLTLPAWEISGRLCGRQARAVRM